MTRLQITDQDGDELTAETALDASGDVLVHCTNGAGDVVSVRLTPSTARMLVAFLEPTVGSADQNGATP